MQLTKDQLLQIDNYVFVSGIIYYDVRTEIVDHFATVLEDRLAKNPNLNFKAALEDIHKQFSKHGFSTLLKEKTKRVQKRFYKASLKHLLSFFKLPKLILTASLFIGLVYLQAYFTDYKLFFNCLLGVAFLLSIVIAWRGKVRHSKKEKFLALSLSVNFFQVFHIGTVSLQFFNNRSADSLANTTHNYALIAAYVLLFLFFWSGEYVFYQHKKDLQTQYPTTII